VRASAAWLIGTTADILAACLGERDGGHRIYVVTDGDDNRSTISHMKLRRELIARGIRVFAFLIVSRGSLNHDAAIGASRTEDLSEFTGGDFVRISAGDLAEQNRAKLNRLASHIVGEVESVYRMLSAATVQVLCFVLMP
jgi:hypothetical protein